MKRLDSIVVRLTLLVAVVITIAAQLMWLIVHRSTSSEFVDYQQEVVTSPNRFDGYAELASELVAAHERNGWQAVQLLAESQPQSTPFLILDSDSRVVFTTDSLLRGAAVTQSLAGTLRLTANQTNRHGESEIELAGLQPIPLRDEDRRPLGQLVPLPQPPDPRAGGRFATRVWEAAAVWLVAVVLAAMLGTAVIIRRSLAPLGRLTAASRQLQQGIIPAKITSTGSTEFVQLIEAFNSATTTIAETESIRKQLISDIAHELRTPVTNLRSQLEALEAGLIEPDTNFLETLLAEERLLERLVEDFQQLALADAGQLRLTIRPLPLHELVSNSVGPLAEQANARLAIDIATSLLVQADEARMRQVMANLMENSIRHRPTGLAVEVSAEHRDDRITLFFRDNGPGVAAADQPYIFERFYRAEKSRNRASGGAGLGLTIAKGIVEAMGGEIQYRAESRPGATFVVTLPAACPADTSE